MTDTKIAQEKMDDIAIYMDDDIREQVHNELAPCAPEEFLRRYVELSPNFKKFLEMEFHIESDEL